MTGRHRARGPVRHAAGGPARHLAGGPTPTATGVRPLLRLLLRRDRVFLPAWLSAIVGVTYLTAAAVRRTYDTPVEVASYAANIGASPASIAIQGPPVALREIGGILVFETRLTSLLGVALLSTFLVVRHTRSEEDAGRVELLGSTVVSPHAVTTAAVIAAAAASLAVGLGVAGSFLLQAQPAAESLLVGAAVAAFGLVFAGVAACAAQLTGHGRGAIGLSLAVLGVAFASRAIGDVGDNAWSWLSPMGWSQQVRVFDDNRWWPLAMSVGLAAALSAATALLESRRDLGAGILPPRPGPAGAGRRLAGVVGLGWRLQRGTVLGWTVGIFAMGLVLGSFTEEIQNMVAANPTLARLFARAGTTSAVDAFLATALLLLAIGASGFAVSSALRIRAEETAGRLEPVLATGVSRSRWLAGSLLVTLLGTTAVVASGGLGVGFSYAAASGRSAEMWRMVGSAVGYLPAPLALAALAVVLFGWAPGAAAAAWAGVAVAFVVGWLGGLLDLPGWVRDLSPFTHVPQVPAERPAAVPLAVLAVLVAAGVAAGWAGFRRRDIG